MVSMGKMGWGREIPIDPNHVHMEEPEGEGTLPVPKYDL